MVPTSIAQANVVGKVSSKDSATIYQWTEHFSWSSHWGEEFSQPWTQHDPTTHANLIRVSYDYSQIFKSHLQFNNLYQTLHKLASEAFEIERLDQKRYLEIWQYSRNSVFQLTSIGCCRKLYQIAEQIPESLHDLAPCVLPSCSTMNGHAEPKGTLWLQKMHVGKDTWSRGVS